MRLKLADHGTAAHASDHKQNKSDAAQPSRSLKPRNSRIILKNIVDAKAEDTGLCRHIEKLRANSQCEMLAPEHVPIP